MPKVSIIIPVYNASAYLSESVESALKQSLEDIEVICIDDGSTDDSLAILRRYEAADKRVRVLTQPNSGGSSARNTALGVASGEYVMFLDADDVYSHTIVGEAYERARLKKVDIVFYNFARFTGKPSKLAVVNRIHPDQSLDFFTKESYAEGFFNDFAIITWNKLIKRSVLVENTIIFNTELSHNHDVDFSIRLMLAAESFSWINSVGYYYRLNSDGITATNRSDPLNVLKILMELNKTVSNRYKVVKPSYDRYIADMITGTAIKYSKDENKMRQVLVFAHDEVIPVLGTVAIAGRQSPVIYQAAVEGQYQKAIDYVSSPSYRFRLFLRRAYDQVQSTMARFTV